MERSGGKTEIGEIEGKILIYSTGQFLAPRPCCYHDNQTEGYEVEGVMSFCLQTDADATSLFPVNDLLLTNHMKDGIRPHISNLILGGIKGISDE